MKFIWTIAFTFPLAAQIDVPREGMMLDHAGALRAVSGIAQSFSVGDVAATDVLSSACSRSLCLAKTANEIAPGVAAPAGRALISVEGDRALIYFAEAKQFARFENSTLTMIDQTVDGEVLALRGSRVVVRRDTGVWIVGLDGSTIAALPAETIAAFLLDGAVLYSTADALVLLRDDGTELRFDIAGITALSQMSEHHIEILASDGIYALRIDAGREQLSILPEAAQ